MSIITKNDIDAYVGAVGGLTGYKLKIPGGFW
jgi:hypothetical protein